MDEQKEHSGLKLDGITIDEGLRKEINAYLVDEAHGGKKVPDHPLYVRQGRVSKNREGIESIVKQILGDSPKADEAKADTIMKRLAYEFAKARDLYQGEIEKFDDKKVMTYLSQMGSETGNPTIGNLIEFRKSITNMAAARPGHDAYDGNSALAQALRFIATLQDPESRELNYIDTLLQQHGTDKRYIDFVQKKLDSVTGKPFSPAATMGEMLRRLAEVGQLQAQKNLADTGKTYLANNGVANYSR